MYNNCGEAQHERMKEREGRKGEGETEREGARGRVSIFSSDKIPKTSSSKVIKLDSTQRGRGRGHLRFAYIRIEWIVGWVLYGVGATGCVVSPVSLILPPQIKGTSRQQQSENDLVDTLNHVPSLLCFSPLPLPSPLHGK